MQMIIARATTPKIIRPAVEKFGVSGFATKMLEQVKVRFHHIAPYATMSEANQSA
jgi:hypothetical protein